MVNKDYDTIQPIATQEKHDLSFLDATIEVADFSSSHHLKTSKKLRKRPWFGYRMDFFGRFSQALIIFCISLTGFLFGLLVLGIPLKTSNIYLLFRYGYTGENQGVQLVDYEGSVLEGPDNQRYFKARGLIFNFEKQFIPHRDFTLSFYTQDRRPLEKYQFSCCEKEFYPRKITKIEEIFPISSDQIGYFQMNLF